MRAFGGLGKLLRDEGGNTLAMMAAAFVPIAGMMGSGLDMSRAYMAKAKLQTACDAAALATRRYMSSGLLTDEAKAEGTKFFNFNFPAATMKTTPVALAIGSAPNDASEVQITASTTVPTSIMKLFGKRSIAISAACNADQDYVNNDIMLVLDVTLSMNCAVGSAENKLCASEETNARVSKLRGAGIKLYQALEGATGVRTRYGFMPYSMTVNVGASLPKITGLNRPSWIRNPARYRRGSGSSFTFSTPNPDPQTNTWFAGGASGWGRCVEERSTYGTSDSNNNPRIGPTVTQQDIDNVSTSVAAQRWQPYDPATQQGENPNPPHASLAAFCPRAASKLKVYGTSGDFDTAFKTSIGAVGGYTFHDIGMMWGMRFLSTTGMFASENPATWAVGTQPAVRVDKHIIFFTDGELNVNDWAYSAYGVDRYDTRMTGSGTQNAKHRAHFLSACQTAREMGMTVWVIALDVNGIDDIKPCASGDDHFYVSDGSNLGDIFTLIGKGIGKLRITK